ncbi:hypothetical protein [Streptomyces sp. NPDC048710]|uniref:hypothetical protein n=1 Tax=unclassified Streptomyces TaxID=2593676 RepID=UPI00371EC50D
MIVESLQGPVPCPSCRATAQWHGVQVLLDDDSLRWDTETACPACGSGTTVCGRDLPTGMRERMLTEHGRTVLRLGASARRPAVMRVLRERLGVGLTEIRALVEQVVAGEYGGTLPETELLARKLRAAGVDAVAVRETPFRVRRVRADELPRQGRSSPP